MPTRNVVLTDHQAQLVERLVGSGHYQNASEVLREGLRLLESRDRDETARMEALRDAVAVGVTDMAAGRYRTFHTAEELDCHLSAVADQTLKDGR